MNEIMESIGVEGLDAEHVFEATLRADRRFSVHVEDADGSASLEDLDVDQIREIHELLGHLLYLHGRS